MRRFLWVLVGVALVVFPVLVMAQGTATVTGRVTDTDGNPLPGANVIIRDLDLGAATDLNGSYRFTIPSQYVKGQTVEITARFIGFHSKTEKITLKPGTIAVDFALAIDVLDMDAVVVTGLVEATPKSKLPFTVARVSRDQVEMAPAANAVESVQGKVPGVTIIRPNGTPGAGVSVNLRGPTKLNLTGRTQEPLYIVDGVILAANEVDIDALDVESIEVVKGAAAASLYGSRAANGVIQIKTRRGNRLALGDTRIRVRNELGFNSLSRKIKLNKHHFYKMNDQGQYIDNDGNVVDFGEAVIDDDHIQDNPFPGKLYDHLDLYFDPGYFYTNTVSVSEHSPSTNYYLAFTNYQESGIIPKFLNGYNRKNVRLNLDHRVRNNFQLSATMYYANSWRDDPRTAVNPFYSLMFINPNVDLEKKDKDGTYIIQPDARTLEENPLYALKYAEQFYKRQRFLGGITARFSPLTWFHLEANASLDRSDRQGTQYYPKGYKTIDASTLNDGRYVKWNSYDQALNASFTASINREFGDLRTKTKFRWLVERDYYDYTYARGDKLTVSDVRDLSVVEGEKIINSTIEDVRAVGYFFITGFEYKGRYIGDILVRRDGSSLFGANQRWHTYYRGSFAWRLTKEPWWFIDDVNEFKLRYSYGTAGGRPSFAAQYETFTVNSGVVSKGNLGNKDLKPEFSIEQEVGVETAFLDRFALELTYASTVTEDQIMLVPLSAPYGFSNQWRNAGTLSSNTIEASLQAFIIKDRNKSWSTSLIFDRTRQEITEFKLPPYRYGPDNIFYARKGEEYGAIYGHKWITKKSELPENLQPYADQFQVNDDGYLVWVGEGNTWKDGLAKHLWFTKADLDGDGSEDVQWGMPMKYVDANGSDFHKIGTIVPDFNMGWSTTFKYKGFTAYMLFNAQVGGHIYNRTRQWPYRELRHGDCDQYGKPEYKKKPFEYYAQLYDVNANNSHFVEDGTYVKLRELSFQYTMDRAQLQNLFGGFVANIFRRVTVGIIGRNLITWTGYKGWDPEVGAGADAASWRYDNFAYPKYRSVTGVIEFEF